MLQQEAVGAVLVGVRNSRHIEDNLRAFDFNLDEIDFRALDTVLARSLVSHIAHIS